MTPEELARFAELEARVSALEQAAGLDVPFLRRLLPAMAAVFGSEAFTISDARRHAGVQAVIGDRSSASLGKLFARSAGIVVAGHELEKLGRLGSRALWRLWRVR